MMLLREVACLVADPLPELELLGTASVFDCFFSRLDVKGVGALAVGVCTGFLGCFGVKRADSCPQKVTSPQATPTKTASAKTRLPDRFAEGCWGETGWPGVIPTCAWSCRYQSKLDSPVQVGTRTVVLTLASAPWNRLALLPECGVRLGNPAGQPLCGQSVRSPVCDGMLCDQLCKARTADVVQAKNVGCAAYWCSSSTCEICLHAYSYILAKASTSCFDRTTSRRVALDETVAAKRRQCCARSGAVLGCLGRI